MNRFLVLMLSVLFPVAAAHAQTFRGAINGSVTDPSGAVLTSASVVATDNATGITYNTVTTTDGEFSFQDLPVGTYSVTITAPGFEKLTEANVNVTAGN